MGLGLLAALLQLPGLFGKDFNRRFVFFRLRQALQHGQGQGGVGNGGDGQALPAGGLPQLVLGIGKADALLMRSGGEGLGPAPGMVGGV